MDEDNLSRHKKVKSSLGDGKRPVIKLSFWLAGRKFNTPASVAKRLSLKFPVIIGRKNLKGLLINPEISAQDKKEIIESK